MRPYFNSNTPNKPVPNFPEVSGLRAKYSTRETDAPNRAHYKQDDLSAQVTALGITLRTVVSTLNRLRIKSSGGAGTQSTSQFQGEYSSTTDSAGGYTTGSMVVISTGDNQGTYVYVNNSASSGVAAPWVGGGYWTQLPGGLYSQWM